MARNNLPLPLPEPEYPQASLEALQDVMQGLEPSQHPDLPALTPESLTPLERASLLLDQKLEGLATDTVALRRLQSRLKAVAASITLSRRLGRGEPSEEAKEAFLVCLGSGLTVEESTALVGSVNRGSWYRLKARDAEFRERWDEALDARVEPVLARLTDVALNGDEANMATINAAKLLLLNQSQRERRDLMMQKQAEVAAMAKGGRPVLVQVNGGTVQLPD